MTLNPTKWLWALAHLLCIFVFAVQVFYLLPDYLSPNVILTEVREVELKDLEFPLDFLICVKPMLNEATLKEFGYNDSIHYKSGMGSFNHSLVGWGGHNKELTAISNATEILQHTRKNMTGLLNRVDIHTISKNGRANIDILNNITLKEVSLVDDCYILNLTNIGADVMKDMHMMTLSLSEEVVRKNNISVEVKIQGRSLATRREILEHRFYSSGDSMTLGRFSSYVVRMKKTVFEAKKEIKKCRPYPNYDFESYKQCDTEYMRARIDELAPDLNLTPPWITDDLNSVTSNPKLVPSNVQGRAEINLN